MKLRDIFNIQIRPWGSRLVMHEPWRRPEEHFHGWDYLRHTARRIEHLASLRIPVHRKTVLEVGAGIGDFSHYYLDRECQITITEAREDNLEYLRNRFRAGDIRYLNLDAPEGLNGGVYDIVHCYGLLYHLRNPESALAFLAHNCKGILLLETCVSFGDEKAINSVSERSASPTQSIVGTGCRPTRPWVFNQLKHHFKHVYLPRTQPNHEEFPVDWTRPADHEATLSRAVFIGSQSELDNDLLSTQLLNQQIRQA